MLAELATALPQYAHLTAEQVASARATIGHQIDLFIRWLIDGREPTDTDLQPSISSARDRAEEGMPLEEILRAYRVAGRVGYNALARLAGPDDADTLSSAADLTMRFNDRLSTVVTRAYFEARQTPTSEDERIARRLVEALQADRPLHPEEHSLGQRLRLRLDPPLTAFALAIGEGTVALHARIARQLRDERVLAVTEGQRVVGLASDQITFAALGLGTTAVWVQRPGVTRTGLAEALAELRSVADLARHAGLSGAVDADELLLELLLRSAPGLTGRLQARALAGLRAHPELLDTLQVLIEHDLDRTAAAGALHVHRNTLLHRVQRIEEITCLRLDRTRDLTTLYLALLATE